jgi:murein DD-endopeptidase MepM/ murein hydrolase activator NlpD
VSADRLDDVTANAPSGAVPASAAPAPDRHAQVVQLAREFESMLMTQMLRDLRRTMLSDESSSDGLGSGAWSDTTDVELGRALTQAGGLGLTNSLLHSLERQTVGDSGGNVNEPVAAPAEPVTPDAAPEVQALPSGRVTSAFGWRRDPLTQMPRFHTGVDIALAYGTPVRAAASGRVVFSGTNGDYGNSVVIEQASGRQVRYAHLASQLVQVGDDVAPGQVIGRSGDSGRTTGAHLHYEILEHGRPVDPSTRD